MTDADIEKTEKIEITRFFVFFGLIMLAISVIAGRYVLVKRHDVETKSFYTTYGIKDDVELAKNKVEIFGKVISEPENKAGYQRLVVSVVAGIFTDRSTNKFADQEQASQIESTESRRIFKDTKILIKNKNQDQQNFQYADYVRFTTKLNRPKNITGEDGRTFDYESYLSKDDIFFVGDTFDMTSDMSSGYDTVTGDQSVNLKSKTLQEKIIIGLYSFKKKFMEHVEQSLPLPHAYLANGLVISGKGSLSKIIQDQFQKVGLIHIVVLSGFNISIIGESIIKILSFLPKILSGILGSIGIILFGIMAGGGATVYRSVIMALIGIYARIFDRKNSAIMSLFLAGTLMLLVNPKLLFEDPGFQLSFMATFGLISLSSPIEKILMSFWKSFAPKIGCKAEPGKILKGVFELISSTLATQVSTLPLIIQFSGLASFVALPVNMIVLPFIPLTMLMVFFIGALSFINPWLSFIPTIVSWFLLSYEFMVVKLGSSVPYGFIKLGPVSKQWIFTLYFVVVLLVSIGNLDIFARIIKTLVKVIHKFVRKKQFCVT